MTTKTLTLRIFTKAEQGVAELKKVDKVLDDLGISVEEFSASYGKIVTTVKEGSKEVEKELVGWSNSFKIAGKDAFDLYTGLSSVKDALGGIILDTGAISANVLKELRDNNRKIFQELKEKVEEYKDHLKEEAQARQEDAARFKEYSKERVQISTDRLELEKKIAEKGANDIKTIELRSAQTIKAIRENLAKDLKNIQLDIASGALDAGEGTTKADALIQAREDAIREQQNELSNAQKLIDIRKDKARQFKQITSDQVKVTEDRLALEKLIAERGEDDLKTIELRSAQNIKHIREQLTKDLFVIQQEIEAGTAKGNIGSWRMRATAVTKKAEKAIREEQGIVQAAKEEKKAISDLLAFKQQVDRETLQNMNKRLAVEQSIAVNGKAHLRTIELKFAEDKLHIEQQLAKELAEIDEKIKDRRITTQEEATNAIIKAQKKASAAITEARIPLDTRLPKVDEINKINTGVANLFTRLFQVHVLWSAQSWLVSGIASTPRSILDVGIALDAVKASLDSTSGSGAATSAILSGIEQEAKRTGLEIGNLRTSFKLFQASTSLAGMSLQDTWKMFTNLNSVASALHLNIDETNNVFLAMAQIFNKSKVQAEELVKQLGNLLPGAYASFAKSIKNADGTIGISTEELTEKMRQGLISASRTMVDFTDFLQKRFAGSFAIASQMLNADIGRMKTSFTLLGEAIYQTTSGPFQEVVKGITNMVDKVTQFVKAEKDFTIGLYGLKDALIGLGTLGLGLIAGKLVNFTDNMIKAGKATSALGAAFGFITKPAVIISGLTAITQAVLDYVSATQRASQTTTDFIEEAIKRQKGEGKKTEAQRLTIAIDESPEIAKIQKQIDETENRLRELIQSPTTIVEPDEARKINKQIEVLKKYDATLTAITEKEMKTSIPSQKFGRIVEARRAYLFELLEGAKEKVKMEEQKRINDEIASEKKQRYGIEPRREIGQADVLGAEVEQLNLLALKARQAGKDTEALNYAQQALNKSYDKAKASVDKLYEAENTYIKEGLILIEQRKKSGQFDEVDRAKEAELKERRKNLDIEIAGEKAKAEQMFLERKEAMEKENFSKIVERQKQLRKLESDLNEQSLKTRLKGIETEKEALDRAKEQNNISIQAYEEERIILADKELQIRLEHLETQRKLNNELRTENSIRREKKDIKVPFGDLFSKYEKQYGLPENLLKAVAWKESRFNPGARNTTSGASGMMQFMPGTARQYGVENPYDPEQAVKGSAKYFQKLLSKEMFAGNIPSALASYNAGEGNVKKYGLERVLSPTWGKGKSYQGQPGDYVRQITKKMAEFSGTSVQQKELLLATRDETQELRIQEQIQQAIEDNERTKAEIRGKSLVDLREYRQLVLETEAKVLALQGRAGEAEEKERLAKDANLRRLARAQNDPGFIKSLNDLQSLSMLEKDMQQLQQKRERQMEELSYEYERLNTLQNVGAITELDALLRSTDLNKQKITLLEDQLKTVDERIKKEKEEHPDTPINPEYERTRTRLQHELEQLKISADSVGQYVRNTLTNSLANSFTGFIMGSQNASEAMRNFATSVLESIARIVAQEAAQRIIGLFVGAAFGAGSSANAAAGVTGSGGDLIPGFSKFSNSIVTQPTIFGMEKYAKGAALMGEAGPEAIIPLSRDKRGNLGINASNMSTGSFTVGDIYVTVQRSANDDGEALGNNIATAIMKKIARETAQTEIRKAQRPGNQLNQTKVG